MFVKYYRYIPYFLLLVGLSFLPFVFWPWAEIKYEIPKTWATIIWIEFTMLATFYFVFAGFFRLGKLNRKFMLVITLFITWVVISSVLGVDSPKSFWGNYYRNDGIFMLIHLALLAIIVSITVNQKWIGRLLRSIGVSTLVLSSITLISWLGISIGLTFIPEWDGASALFFGNPHFLAGYLLVTLPITLSYYKKLSLIQVLALLSTGGYSAIIIMVLYLSFVAFRFFQKAKVLVLLVGIVAVSASAFLYVASFRNANPNILIAESRQRIYTKAIMWFIHRPLSGWGWANFDYAFESVNWPIKLNDDVYVDKAHSEIIEIAVTTGAVGILFYSILIAWVFSGLRKGNLSEKSVLLQVLVLFLIHSQTNIISISESSIFWVIAGISAARSGSKS